MTDQTNIRANMEVVDVRGDHVGTVDHVEGDQIMLTRSSSPDGEHHFLPLEWVEHVDDKVHLHQTCDNLQCDWRNSHSATKT